MDIKKKSLGFCIGFVSAAIALITAIVLLIYGGAVGDFYAIPSVILVIGAALGVVGLMKNIPALAICPGVCYMAALALYVTSQMGNISGRLSDTGFGATGTTLEMLITFCVLMVVATILALVASFMKQGKEAA